MATADWYRSSGRAASSFPITAVRAGLQRPSSEAGGRRDWMRCSNKRVSGAWNGRPPLTIS